MEIHHFLLIIMEVVIAAVVGLVIVVTYIGVLGAARDASRKAAHDQAVKTFRESAAAMSPQERMAVGLPPTQKKPLDPSTTGVDWGSSTMHIGDDEGGA